MGSCIFTHKNNFSGISVTIIYIKRLKCNKIVTKVINQVVFISHQLLMVQFVSSCTILYNKSGIWCTIFVFTIPNPRYKMNTIETKATRKFTPIIWIGLIAGTLDALAALLWNYNTSPAVIFKFIASGAFGKAAFAGGAAMVLWGVFFHFLIAYSFTAVFYLMYVSFISTLRNKYIIAIVFALITWIITNLVIVPVSQIGWHAMNISSILIGFGILIFTIGLPIALISDKIYASPVA